MTVERPHRSQIPAYAGRTVEAAPSRVGLYPLILNLLKDERIQPNRYSPKMFSKPTTNPGFFTTSRRQRITPGI